MTETGHNEFGIFNRSFLDASRYMPYHWIQYMKKILPLIFVNILMPVALYVSLFVAPAESVMGEYSRLLYLHVPLALCSVVSFFLSAFYSSLYLKKRNLSYEIIFHSASRLGLLCTLLTTATGAVWAKLAWGSWWNWDPRETSILFIMITYFAYFALTASLKGKNSSAKIRAAYLIFASVITMFFIFVVPRTVESLHPDPIINAQRTVRLTGEMRIALLVSAAAFLSFLAVLISFDSRIAFLKARNKKYV
jgi:heme exporter protein C